MQQFLEYRRHRLCRLFSDQGCFSGHWRVAGGDHRQVAFYKATKRPLSNELKITFWVSLVLGGMTLLLRDETFIQWKPSIVSWAIALGLAGAQLFGGISLLKKMMGAALTLEDSVWRKLTYGWATGFAAAGASICGKQFFHGRLGDLQAVRPHGSQLLYVFIMIPSGRYRCA